MPRFFIRRGDVPATMVVVGHEDAQVANATVRAAIICHRRGQLMIIQVPDEDDYRLIGYRGRLLPKPVIDSILEEVAAHDIPDDHWVAVHRENPFAKAG